MAECRHPAESIVHIKAHGDRIDIICNREEQMQKVINRMSNKDCVFEGFEHWDDDEDSKWILTFKVLDEFDKYPDYN